MASRKGDKELDDTSDRNRSSLEPNQPADHDERDGRSEEGIRSLIAIELIS
jgi:hypothetical protein